jgi:hypothetical protein
MPNSCEPVAGAKIYARRDANLYYYPRFSGENRVRPALHQLLNRIQKNPWPLNCTQNPRRPVAVVLRRRLPPELDHFHLAVTYHADRGVFPRLGFPNDEDWHLGRALERLTQTRFSQSCRLPLRLLLATLFGVDDFLGWAAVPGKTSNPKRLPLADSYERSGDWHLEGTTVEFSPVDSTWGRAINLRRPWTNVHGRFALWSTRQTRDAIPAIPSDRTVSAARFRTMKLPVR